MSTRTAVIESTSLRGARLARELAERTDEWLADLWHRAMESHPITGSCALLAIGGYGRGELAPYSDLDVMLVHEGQRGVDALASQLWYPIWDEGLALGHAVCTLKQALERSREDIESATALLTIRTIAGDPGLADRLSSDLHAQWRRQASKTMPVLVDKVRERQQRHGEVAYLLEPNVKEGYGGLRDIHALAWAEASGIEIRRSDRASLASAHEVLMNVRVALHRLRGRADEVVRLEDQDALASACGYSSADALMSSLSSVGRTVAWVGDEVWARVDAARRKPQPDKPLTPGVVQRAGEVHLDDTIDPASDPTLLLRIATAAARHRARIDRITLDRLAQQSPSMPSPWPAGAIDDLVGLLLCGHDALPVLEALDQRGLWIKVLPEWAPNRARPQRNAYHRFTVDRHLWEASAQAARLVERVTRPDLLVLGALFHDIGKGYPGDHSEVGVELVRRIGPRLGLPQSDTDTLAVMVQHHLLLPDIATRRDLADPQTVAFVIEQVGDATTLDLLHALTEADGLATGPSAWGSWKAELVADLVARVHTVLDGEISVDQTRHASWRMFPDEHVLETMALGHDDVFVSDDAVTIVSPDRPGTFSRVSGVLALHSLDVIGAQAHSDEQGMAASRFRVLVPDHGPIDWTPVVDNLYRALRGELAIEARLAERARHYRPKRRTSATVTSPRVTFIEGASSNATVIEVRTPDRHGVLHAITRAFAELGLDIRHATVQTIGDDVIDSFYVRTMDKRRVDDPDHRREIERAVLFTLDSDSTRLSS